MSDFNSRPLPESILDTPLHENWPDHQLSRPVPGAPNFLTGAVSDAPLGLPVTGSAADAEALVGARDNRPARSKRWMPLVVPLMALMLAVAAGSVLILET